MVKSVFYMCMFNLMRKVLLGSSKEYEYEYQYEKSIRAILVFFPKELKKT